MKSSWDERESLMTTPANNGEFMRTYKVGLRVPESLLKKQDELVMTLEILHHLHREMRNPGKSKLFTGKVNHGSDESRQQYELLLERYTSLTALQQVDMKIKEVKKALKILHEKDPTLRSERLFRKDLPKFTDPAAPQPSEMSLTDYQHLARTGLKLISKHLNDRVLREVARIPHVKGELCDVMLYNWMQDLECSRMECLSEDKPSRNWPRIGRV